MRSIVIILAAGILVFGTACGRSSAPSATAPAPEAGVQPAAETASGRVNGTVQRLDGEEVILQDGKRFSLSSDAIIIRSFPAEAQDLQPGEFVAVTATRQPDDTLLASVVNIFPESMRGLGVGHRPMDGGNLMTNATISDLSINLMTNATIDDMTSQTFMVSFPGGGDEVRLAEDARVNRFEAATVHDLQPGTIIRASVNNGTAQFVTIT